MNRAQCLAQARAVARSAGFRSFAALHDLVICKGFTGQDTLTLAQFTQAQHAFHTAQSLVWAAEAQDRADRARWVRCAGLRSFYAWLAGYACAHA